MTIMKHILITISLFLSLAASSQVVLPYKVSTIAAMKAYNGAANQITVEPGGSTAVTEYILCTSCTADESTIYAGAGGKNWKLISSGGGGSVGTLDAVLGNGNSSVTRLIAPVADKGGAVFNILAYGAVPNDGIDDRSAWIACEAAAGAAGGTIVIPQGVYNSSGTWGIIHNNVKVEATGAILRPNAGGITSTVVASYPTYAAIAIIGVSNCAIRGLAVDLVTNQTLANGIMLGTDGSGNVAQNCMVEKCRIDGWNAHIYLIWNQQGRYNTIQNNILNGHSTPSLSTPVDLCGIEIYGGKGIGIFNNIVDSVGSECINLMQGDISAPINKSNIDDISVLGNQLNVCSQGIKINAETTSSNILVSNNRITGAIARGFRIFGLSSTTFKNIKVSNNIFTNSSTANAIGIWADGTSNYTGWSNVTFENNTISNYTGSNTVAMYGSDVANIDFLNNTAENITGNGVFMSNVRISKVLNNLIKNVDLNGLITNGCYRINATDNKFIGYNRSNANSNGVIFSEFSSNCVAANNTFSFDSTASESYAVYIPNGVNNSIFNNTLSYTTTFASPFRNDATGGANEFSSISNSLGENISATFKGAAVSAGIGTLGTTAKRWPNIFATIGNYSGIITSQSGTNGSLEITPSSDTTPAYINYKKGNGTIYATVGGSATYPGDYVVQMSNGATFRVAGTYNQAGNANFSNNTIFNGFTQTTLGLTTPSVNLAYNYLRVLGDSTNGTLLLGYNIGNTLGTSKHAVTGAVSAVRYSATGVDWFAEGSSPANTAINTTPKMSLSLAGVLSVPASISTGQYKLSALNTAPTSATDTGTVGEIRDALSGGVYYHFFCIATNTWVRVAYATW